MSNMKREADLDIGGLEGGKRIRGGGVRFETRVLVPSKMAGSVIGKGGSNIQKLRSEYNAQVRIPDCPGPERVITVQAASVEDVVGVLQMAIPFMYEQGQEDDGGERELRLLIHQSIVGGVIGKSGAKIKEIRENTGAHIKVYSNCAPQSTDRCVQVSGDLDKIVSALSYIFEVVANTDVRGPIDHYDPINFDAFYANEYGGYGGSEIGMGGRGGRGGGRGGPRGGFGDEAMLRGGRGGGPHMRGGFGGRGGRGFGGHFGGPPGDFGGDMDLGGRGFGRGGRGFGRGGGGGNFGRGMDQGFRGDFGGGGLFNNSDSPGLDFGTGDTGEGSESTQVTIPNDLAGAIIGPGGQRIRRIRADSRAMITIEEPAQGSSDRVITISGDGKAIQTAQYLLQQSVRENMGRGGGGARGGY